MLNYIKRILLVSTVIASIIAGTQVISSAVTGEVMLNSQDADVTTYLKPIRVKDAGNLGDDATEGMLSVGSYGYDGTTWDSLRHSFTQTTSSITTNAAGTILDITTTPMSKYTLLVDRTAGSTDTVEVDLECSLGGGIYVQIATITDLTNEPVLASQDGTPCNYIRYNVVTVGSGNTLIIVILATR